MSFKNTLLPVANLLQSKGNLLDLSTPIVMGIINATPDSFFSESRKENLSDILAQAHKMISEGAAILDIGGQSTRPNAQSVSDEEELNRILPAILAIKKAFPKQWISIDTYRANVAKAAVVAGADIVNDISGGSFDTEMISTVAQLNVPFIAMHLRGNFETMHQAVDYKNLTVDIIDDFQKILEHCREVGIKDLILDPGFGFSKNSEQNFELLSQMAQLRLLGKPILAGVSRKSMIYKTLVTDAANALNGTTALNMVALQQGASILRVHDVKAAVETIKLFNNLF